MKRKEQKNNLNKPVQRSTKLTNEDTDACYSIAGEFNGLVWRNESIRTDNVYTEKQPIRACEIRKAEDAAAPVESRDTRTYTVLYYPWQCLRGCSTHPRSTQLCKLVFRYDVYHILCIYVVYKPFRPT